MENLNVDFTYVEIPDVENLNVEITAKGIL